MIDFDYQFMAASIAMQRTIFDAELESRFAIWDSLPSEETRACVRAWKQLGPRARAAHDQRLAHYYRGAGLEAALSTELHSIRSRAEFDEWKTICIQAQMGGFDPFGGLIPPAKIKDKQAKGRVEESLRNKNIGFESSAKPLFRTKSRCVVYLEVTQRNHFVGSRMMCCRKETPMPLANHCGLHGIVTECDSQVLTTSPDAVEIVAYEIVRHVEMLREKLS